MREGSSVALLSFGARPQERLGAADRLSRHGLSATDADARSAKQTHRLEVCSREDFDATFQLSTESEKFYRILVASRPPLAPVANVLEKIRRQENAIVGRGLDESSEA